MLVISPAWVSGNSSFASIWSHISVGLTTVGFIFLVLEPFELYRQNEAIKKILNTSAVAHLQSLISPSLFKKIEKQIIEQPFLRKKTQFFLHLEPLQGQPEYLLKTVTLIYEVQNVSRTRQEFPLFISIDCEHEDLFPESSKLIRVCFECEGQKTEKTETELSRASTSSNDRKQVNMPFSIKRKQSAIITANFQNIVPARWRYSIFMSYPTESLEITLSYPKQLRIVFDPKDPEIKMTQNTISENLTHYKIQECFLPYQGIEFRWNPDRPSAPLSSHPS